MKRKILFSVFAVLLCVTLIMPAFAAKDCLVDDADLLTKSEERSLQEDLQALGEEFDVDIVIVTVETTGQYDPATYIEFFYDDNRYGQGSDRAGVMLLVAMAEREYMILTNGWCDDAIGSSGIDFIVEAMQDEMRDGEYDQAFGTFVDECQYYLDGHINGFPFEFGFNLLIALVVGLVVALIATGIMRSKLKSVKKQHTANQYTKAGSMRVTKATDLYLYSNVTRVRKAQSSSGSGSRSSGGRSVGGGRF